ncbi:MULTISPECIES: MrcB family domain-containing protein [Bacteria]|uniref:MrcB family domain-containing protein n=3 Tax=cellular organisms TaxID=131567 RepID=UPI001651A640|nr:DUF3578 domain-containing protein [Stenotrophomonas maltophilia]MBH1478300.1 DUF3578 domain-containing protein [Stenotrophomonas maltophilia]MBH1503602.1 DUF3578 domain-containing protein [Stenotrophomonas maltophilia]MBH1785878.1 DUF3578 domain-containing protein [Stenotrophomonas maltophilia]
MLELQSHYSSLATTAMNERGRIIRHQLPTILREEAERLRTTADIAQGDFLIEGRDGAGRRALVPWVRFASRSRSPKATEGWYVVWLFREDGSGVYLGLSHASTKNVNGDFIERPTDETQRLTKWAREILANDVSNDSRIHQSIALGFGDLARAYERTTVVSYFYPKADVPPDEQLQTDMLSMARRLKSIYRGEPAQKRSGQTSPDVIAVVEAIEEAASGRERTGQGFGLTQPERRAVELRAMALAKSYFHGKGYAVEDTSSHAPYDLKIVKDSQTHYVEVKGTTGGLGDIVLTKNEVQHHLNHHPNNALFVVYGIQLHTQNDTPIGTGGTDHVQQPWLISNDRLQPLAYRYRIE